MVAWGWNLSREDMEAVWNKPGVQEPLGGHTPRPSPELREKIKRECPNNAKALLEAYGKTRTKFDAPYAERAPKKHGDKMNFDRAAVENHVALLHQLAANCGNGVLILAPIWEGRNPCIQKFGIGHTKQMIDAIMAFDGVWGVNLYSCYATMRENLEPGKKGGERDVEYVFGVTADIDNDKGGQRTIDIVPSYSISTSPWKTAQGHAQGEGQKTGPSGAGGFSRGLVQRLR